MTDVIQEGKDFMGNKIVPGDVVAFKENNSPDMQLGRIERFTLQTIRVERLFVAPMEKPIRLSSGVYRPTLVTVKAPRQLVLVYQNEIYKHMASEWLEEVLADVSMFTPPETDVTEINIAEDEK